MNVKTLERLKEAGKYQKMAVKALLPEYAHKHVEVIESELKAIVWECIGETVKNQWAVKAVNAMESTAENKQEMSGKKVKSIVID